MEAIDNAGRAAAGSAGRAAEVRHGKTASQTYLITSSSADSRGAMVLDVAAARARRGNGCRLRQNSGRAVEMSGCIQAHAALGAREVNRDRLGNDGGSIAKLQCTSLRGLP
jgi:hypothetical protein